MVNLCNFRTKFLTEMYLMILQRTLKFSGDYKDVIFLNCIFSNSLNCESVSRFFSVIITGYLNFQKYIPGALLDEPFLQKMTRKVKKNICQQKYLLLMLEHQDYV